MIVRGVVDSTWRGLPHPSAKEHREAAAKPRRDPLHLPSTASASAGSSPSLATLVQAQLSPCPPHTYTQPSAPSRPHDTSACSTPSVSPLPALPCSCSPRHLSSRPCRTSLYRDFLPCRRPIKTEPRTPRCIIVHCIAVPQNVQLGKVNVSDEGCLGPGCCTALEYAD